MDNEQLQKKKQMDDDEENYDEDDEIEGLVQSAEIISFNKL